MRAYRKPEVENDLTFLTLLKDGVINYPQKFPNIAIIVKDLPKLEHPGTIFEIFNDTTREEYHSLFMEFMKQYKACVKKIATMASSGKPFRDKLDPAFNTGTRS